MAFLTSAAGAERTRRMRKLAYGRRRGRHELSAPPLDPPPVSGGERALDPLSVAARRFAAVLREGAREGELGGVADEVGDAGDRLLALAEEPCGELDSPAGEVRGRRFADEVVEPAHERRS